MKSAFWFFALIVLISCNKQENYETPKRTIISGKISNYDLDNREIEIFANRVGFKPLNLTSELDSLGNFYAAFESYIPTDVGIRYKSFFHVLTNPDDSVFIDVNASTNRLIDFFNAIKISGDNAVTNQSAVEFQKRYFTSSVYNDWNAKQKAFKKLDSTQYLNYLDITQQKLDSIFNDFVDNTSPNKQAAQWAEFYIEQEYYKSLFMYPSFHAETNNQKTDSYRVPTGYFDVITGCLPLEDSKYKSGHILSDFINHYTSYISECCWAEEENQKYKDEGRYHSGPIDIMDSIDVYSIIKYTHDTLLRQIVLTNKFSTDFSDYSEIECFEKHKDVVEKYIKEPFLKEPLYEEYYQLKKRLTNPQVASNTLLNSITNLSLKQLIDNIKQSNQGKVIYIDCWATWCGPCKAEMPNTKKLIKKMEGKDVAFVFLCLDSQKNIWKENLSQLKIEGQHYLLNQQQSNDVRKTFEIQGIPFYVLIDKNGIIEDKGSHLRANIVKDKIEKLLNE